MCNFISKSIVLMITKNQDVFQLLSESISEGVVIIDEHQVIVALNSTTENMFGYNSEELLQEPLNVLIPTSHKSSHKKQFNEFFNLKEKRRMGIGKTFKGLRKDGTVFPLEVGLNQFTIYNKTYIMALIVDISARNQIEINLMLKSKALESASNGIVITDALKKDNPIIYCNPAFIELTGYKEEEILNMNCRFLQSDDRDQDSIKKIRQAIKKGESCQATIRNYKKDRTLFWNELNITPIKNKQGKVTHFIGIQNNVTERKKQEFFRKKQNHILELIAEDNHLYEVLKDIVLLIEELNEDVLVSILMHNEEEQTLVTLAAPNIPEAFNSSIDGIKIGLNVGSCGTAAFLKKEVIVTDIATDPIWKDCKNLAKEHGLKACWSTPILSSKNKILGTFAIYRKSETNFNSINKDIISVGNKLAGITIEKYLIDKYLEKTQKQLKDYNKNLEQQVEEKTKELQMALKNEKELNELKTKFLSLVSHEFKTPLSGILTSAMLLKKYHLEDQQDKRNKHIDTIANIVNHLNNILNDFLSIEKMESGKVDYHFKTFKLSKVLNEVIYNSNMLLKDGQKINYPENIDDLTLIQDEKTLELTLTNIVHNAVKYSPENSIIDIVVTQNKNVTTFKIIDNGIGIPKKDQKNIFNRYFRAENVLNTQGTGIGLNIVKNHIENLGGSITFSSIENKGSTFVVTLPNKPIK